jgi:lipoprotein-releasing system permease protein
VSSIADDFCEGSFAPLNVSGNNMVVSDRMAERLGASLVRP